MTAVDDIRVLYHLLVAPKRGATEEERLESFYAGQASRYDGFRERLLQGRRELVTALPWHGLKDGVWIDLGGGTGACLEYAGDARLASLRRAYVVDFCPSLLRVAEERVERHRWKNVAVVNADASTFRPPELADVVTLSYSLTMMSDWLSVLDNAYALLKPGGTIAVVDFYVARKHPPTGWTKQRWLTRTFWATWFAFDDVFLSPDHAVYLHRKFHATAFDEGRARLPYFPVGRAPFYRFVGEKPA